jgi:hypothetical protein
VEERRGAVICLAALTGIVGADYYERYRRVGGRRPARATRSRAGCATLVAGRKRVQDTEPHIKRGWGGLVELSTAGEPMSYLIWPNKWNKVTHWLFSRSA